MTVKITKIHSPRGSTSEINFIDQLIQKRIFNDALFEEIFIQASVILDSPVQMFYRKLWETAYLKRPYSTDVMNDKHAIVMMSISECIQYLQEITPPKMRNLLDDNMTSVKSIQQMMTDFLTNTDDKLYPYYLTKFYDVFHLNIFENAWIPDYKKIAFARKIVQDDILCLVDASSISIQTIIEEPHNIKSDVWIQLNFHCDTEDGMENLYRFIGNNDIHISGVQCNDIGLFVSGYTSRLCPALANMIANVYAQFMK